MTNTLQPSRGQVQPSRGQELRAFLVLAVFLAPIVAVLVVSGFGFLVWMFQLIAGPPGSY